MVGLTNVNAATTSIYKIDYSETKAYTFNAMGFSGIGYDAEKNALVITNDDDSGNPWDIQPMIAEGYAFDSSCDYKIVITMKANAAGSVQCRIGTWGYEIYQSFSFTAGDEYNDYTINITKPNDASGCFILWQGKKFKGEAVIQKIEVFEIAPDEVPVDEDMYDKTIPEGFEDLIENGDLEGSGVSNFVANDYPEGQRQETVPVRVVTEPGNESNHVIVITSNDNASEAWDSQFFITVPEENAFGIGDIVRLRMRIKAEAKGSASSQFQVTPGDYVGGEVGSASFKTVWTNFDSGEVEMTSGSITNGNNGHGPSHTIAFNLSVKGGVSNTFYIDEVQLLVKKAPVIESWADIIENGDLSDNDDARCFYSKEYPSTTPLPSTIEDGAIVVKSPVKNSQDHDTQFWIRLPQTLPAGTRFKISFDYKASAESQVGTQYHEEPGNYIHYQCLGNVDFTTSWQTFTSDEMAVAPECNGEMADGGYNKNFRSIAFNLSKDTPITYYFKNIKFEISEDEVTEASFRDDPTATYFSVGADEWATFNFGKSVSFGDDVTAYAATYDAETASVKLNEVNNIPAYTGVVVTAAEGDHAANFIASDDAEAVADNDLVVSDGSAKGNGSIYVLAKGSNDVVGFYLLADDEVVPAGKGYLVIEAEGREFIGFAGDATTVKAVETLKKSGIIYNLAGQQVKNAQKGIFIIDGKKVIK